jgi:hypothetical protein
MNLKRVSGFILVVIGTFLVLNNPSITGFSIKDSFSIPSFVVKQLLGTILILGGIFLVSAEAIRHSRQGVPAGTFYAARFIGRLDSEEGYHIHPSYLEGPHYKDSKYFITIENGYFVAVPHNEGARKTSPPIDLSTKSAIKALRSDLYEEFKKLKKRSSYRQVPSVDRGGLVRLFGVDEI